MPSLSDRSKRATLVVALALLVAALALPSVNALPGFSDHTGPSDLRVAEFERLDAGCADAVGDYAGGSIGDGRISKVTTVRAPSAAAPLSVRVERTSPPGADLSTFAVRVDAHEAGSGSASGTTGGSAAASTESGAGSCPTEIQYRAVLEMRGGSPEGLLPDAHGIRVAWYENGRFWGCSSSVTSPLNGSCATLADSRRVWANATAA